MLRRNFMSGLFALLGLGTASTAKTFAQKNSEPTGINAIHGSSPDALAGTVEVVAGDNLVLEVGTDGKTMQISAHLQRVQGAMKSALKPYIFEQNVSDEVIALRLKEAQEQLMADLGVPEHLLQGICNLQPFNAYRVKSAINS